LLKIIEIRMHPTNIPQEHIQEGIIAAGSEKSPLNPPGLLPGPLEAGTGVALTM